MTLARRISAWALWACGVVLVTYGATQYDEGLWAFLDQTLGGVAFGLVGLVLSTKTDNLVGWLLLGVQVGFGISLLGHEGPVMVLLAAILLVFPSGHVPSKRWRIAVVALLFAGASALFDAVVGFNDDYSWFIFMGLVVPVLIASAVRVLNDYRRAEGDTRQQLKWLAWVLLVGGLILLASMVPLPYIDDAHDLAGVILTVGSPIAIGLAVLRYRLYEIDRIISRTVSYSLVVGIIALLVAVLALLIGTMFSEPWVVAATTLGVAAVFSPLQRRVQAWVDRRFNRSKYDHESVARRFTSSLRERTDFDEVVNGWVTVVTQTMQPTKIGVWTRTS